MSDKVKMIMIQDRKILDHNGAVEFEAKKGDAVEVAPARAQAFNRRGYALTPEYYKENLAELKKAESAPEEKKKAPVKKKAPAKKAAAKK